MARDPELLHAFIRQGYSTYPQAFEAVDLFESEVHRAIAKTFDSKTAWLGVQRRRTGETWAPIAKNQRSARAISASVWCQPVGDETNVAITLGLIWNTPNLGPGVIAAYAHYWFGRAQRQVIPPPEFAERVKVGTFEKRNDHRVYLVVDESFELEEGFALLLDAIDSGIAMLNAPPSR